MVKHRFEEYTRELSKYTWWKNIFDRFLALLAIVILSPFLALIAILVRVDSPGSPIFRQERVGKDERRFTIYKFRTMYEDNDDSKYKAFLQKYVFEDITSRLDENGQDIYELVYDPRVTRFGSLLRKASLDELLQLVNVLKGEMAFVGPRPDIPFTVAMYQPHHRDRLRVRPGITGLWQVSGRRSLSFEETVRLDIDYVNRQSLLLDAKILLLTVREILTRDVQSV
jgi:lipopolysaccharide/colanic/teichoic acid biosynthesis glycosyltransferase